MNKNRKAPLAVVLVMIIIIFALVYGFFIRPNYHLVNGGTIYLDAVFADKLDVAKDAKITTMDDMIYIANREGITKLSLNGEHIWNKSYHFNELLLLHETPYLAAVDITGKEAFVFDENGSIARIQTDYTIISGMLNESGFLSLVTENGGEHYINLYNFKGEMVVKRRTVFRDDGYPIYVALSPNAQKMMTSHLYVSKHEVESVITFMDFSGIGEEYTDKVVGHERIQNTMASKMHYFDETHSVVVGDSVLMFYNTDPTPKLVKAVSVKAKIKEYILTDDGIVISYGEAFDLEGAEQSNKVINYEMNGKVTGSLSFDAEVTDLTADGGTFYVILSSKVMKYDNDKLVWETTLHKKANEVYKLTNNRFLIVYPYDYEVLEIHDI